MKNFPIAPATKRSISKRKLVYGVGINDADYITNPKVNGKTLTCPIYRKWQGMLERCYSERYQLKKPTYVGCKVSDEWLVFSMFHKWMIKQDWQGKQLDKDLIVNGNKIYGPTTCVFVSHLVNNLIMENSKTRGELMIGVSIHKGRYMAQCQSLGHNKWIGYFNSEIDAHKAYASYKYSIIKEVASKQCEPIRSALLSYVIPQW